MVFASLLGWELSRKWAVALPTWGQVPEILDEERLRLGAGSRAVWAEADRAGKGALPSLRCWPYAFLSAVSSNLSGLEKPLSDARKFKRQPSARGRR